MKAKANILILLMTVLTVSRCGLETGPLAGLLPGTVGVRNHFQVKGHFEGAFNTVADGDSDIEVAFLVASPLLPAGGEVWDLGPQAHLLFINLAGAFCEKAFDDDFGKADNATDRWVYREIPIKSTDPLADLVAFDEFKRRKLIRRLTELLWHRLPSDAEETILLEALDEADNAIGKGERDYSPMKQLGLVACTIIAANVDSLRN